MLLRSCAIDWWNLREGWAGAWGPPSCAWCTVMALVWRVVFNALCRLMGSFLTSISIILVSISAPLCCSNFTMTRPQAIAVPDPLPDLPEIGSELKQQVYAHVGTTIQQSNRRLLMLGSKCLSASVAAILFEICDGRLMPRQMNDLLNKYVSGSTVGTWAREYDFHLQVHVVGLPHLDSKSTIPGDAFQAYLAATTLRFSQERLTDFLRKLLEPELSKINAEEDDRHDMTVQTLHERLGKLEVQMPTYSKEEEKSGEEHERFQVKCRLGSETIGKGVGRNFKIAKCKAAESAMRKTDRQLTMLKEKKDNKSED
jgi:dsRNA-specific ribonuclease